MSSEMTINEIERELLKADRMWVSARLKKDKKMMTVMENRFNYIYNQITPDQFCELSGEIIYLLDTWEYVDSYPFHEGRE